MRGGFGLPLFFICSLRGLLHCRCEQSTPARYHHACLDCIYWERMKRPAGFTLVELVMTMVIIGIIAAVAVPRFFDSNVFQSRGFADQVQATLRYAQKVAIAQRRFVCVAFTANSITLTTGATTACGTALQSPAGEASYVISAPANTTFAAVPAAFSFNALGSPSFAAAQAINITGATNAITIEAETGYVHSP